MESASETSGAHRTDTENFNTEPQWTRHDYLYMSDGTIVLLADTTLFRTYTGLLAMNSEVFRGMASLSAQQPLDAETYDGCSLVRLSDSAHDLACFLRALMDTRYFPDEAHSIRFHAAAGILRLATKYMVPALRMRAIANISRVIPTTFDEIAKKNENAFRVFSDRPHPFIELALLRECRANTLLPWSYYRACQTGLDALLRGELVDGEIVRLSPGDIHLAVSGWSQLAREEIMLMLNIIVPSDTSFHCSRCNSTDKIDSLKRQLPRLGTSVVDFGSRMTHKSRFTCADHNPACEEAELRNLWENLPAYFDLPRWAELSNNKY